MGRRAEVLGVSRALVAKAIVLEALSVGAPAAPGEGSSGPDGGAPAAVSSSPVAAGRRSAASLRASGASFGGPKSEPGSLRGQVPVSRPLEAVVTGRLRERFGHRIDLPAVARREILAGKVQVGGDVVADPDFEVVTGVEVVCGAAGG